MLWIGIVIGLLVGASIGVFLTGLLVAASDERKQHDYR